MFFQGNRAKKYFVYFKTDNEEKTNFQSFEAGLDNHSMAIHPLLFNVEFKCPSPHPYTLYKTNGYKARYKITSAIAYKRKRNSRYRHKTYAHTDIFNNVEQKHSPDTYADKLP